MPPYICMPPVHKQHKESMLCQTKGVSICPHRFRCHHMLGYLLCVGMPPLCLDAAIYLDAPPVCLNAILCLNTPICLDTPVSLDVPICLDTFICLDTHLYVSTYPICLHSPYVWMPLYVWVPPIFGHPSVWLDIPTCLDTPCMFGCPPYVWLPLCVWMWASKHMEVSKCIRGIQNKHHKESMLCQTKGVSICPHRFRCHHMLGYHLCVGMPPLCLDAAICLDAPLYV